MYYEKNPPFGRIYSSTECYTLCTTRKCSLKFTYHKFDSNVVNPNVVMYMAEDDVVFVGNKPVMNYVLAVVTQFNSGTDEVRIMARGRAISRAVDVAEVSRSRFLGDVSVKDIQISTETLNTDRGETNVSAIEITLAK